MSSQQISFYANEHLKTLTNEGTLVALYLYSWRRVVNFLIDQLFSRQSWQHHSISTLHIRHRCFSRMLDEMIVWLHDRMTMISCAQSECTDDSNGAGAGNSDQTGWQSCHMCCSQTTTVTLTLFTTWLSLALLFVRQFVIARDETWTWTKTNCKLTCFVHDDSKRSYRYSNDAFIVSERNYLCVTETSLVLLSKLTETVGGFTVQMFFFLRRENASN